MWSWIHRLGSPKHCYNFAGKIVPWVGWLALVLFMLGLYTGLWVAPADYQQGNAFRIIYIHVPAAIWAMAIYVLMSAASIVYLVWKIKVADMVASVSVSVGALFAFLTLVTGSLWGRPTWGTYRIWDARLTSMLILLFIYFGVMAVRTAMPDRVSAAKAAAMVTLVGLVDLPIIHYSVDWWNTLHQGATILKWGTPSISTQMLYPLLVMIAAYGCYFIWIMLVRLRQELLLREQKSTWVKRHVLGERDLW